MSDARKPGEAGGAIDTARWFRLLTPLLTLAILGPLLLATYWLAIDRAPPVTVTGGEVTGHYRQANGAYVVFVRWHGERHRHCPGNSRRWLTGGVVLPLPDIPYPPVDPDTPPGTLAWEVPVEIPGYFVTSGHLDLAYRITIDYACNPLQEVAFPIRVEPPPVPFELRPDGSITSGGW